MQLVMALVCHVKMMAALPKWMTTGVRPYWVCLLHPAMRWSMASPLGDVFTGGCVLIPFCFSAWSPSGAVVAAGCHERVEPPLPLQMSLLRQKQRPLSRKVRQGVILWSALGEPLPLPHWSAGTVPVVLWLGSPPLWCVRSFFFVFFSEVAPRTLTGCSASRLCAAVTGGSPLCGLGCRGLTQLLVRFPLTARLSATQNGLADLYYADRKTSKQLIRKNFNVSWKTKKTSSIGYKNKVDNGSWSSSACSSGLLRRYEESDEEGEEPHRSPEEQTEADSEGRQPALGERTCFYCILLCPARCAGEGRGRAQGAGLTASQGFGSPPLAKGLSGAGATSLEAPCREAKWNSAPSVNAATGRR